MGLMVAQQWWAPDFMRQIIFSLSIFPKLSPQHFIARAAAQCAGPAVQQEPQAQLLLSVQQQLQVEPVK